MTENSTDVISTQYSFSNSVVVKNRILKSAMSEQMGDRAGNPTEKLEKLYSLWARGGAGISVTGNIMVDREAVGGVRDVVLDESSDLDSFHRWTSSGSENNTCFWAQINHPGKQIARSLCAEPVAPSVVELGGDLNRDFGKPRMLAGNEISTIIEKFGRCAALCKEVGFGGVQIHAAHGYLISQFLSPLHNVRTDKWGGSLNNRMRFIIAIYECVRQKVGHEYPVSIKLNSADFQRGGFTEEESMAVAKQLDSIGINQIEISGGTYENPVMMGNLKQSTIDREAYFLEYAKNMRRHVNTSLAVTGGFRSALAMAECIQSGAADFVGTARAMVLDPAFASKVLQNAEEEISLPVDSDGSHMSVSWYESKIRGLVRGL